LNKNTQTNPIKVCTGGRGGGQKFTSKVALYEKILVSRKKTEA